MVFPAAWVSLLLLSGCAAPARRIQRPAESLFPAADYGVLLSRLHATRQGGKLLAALHAPIEIVYDESKYRNNLIASYGSEQDKRHRPLRHVVLLHPNLRKVPPSHPLVALVVAHELTHAYQKSALPPQDKGLLYYSEEDAYSAAMRVWIELDPDRRQVLPSGLVRDFEGRDLAKVLEEMRGVYERSLEEFVDMIRLRYHRLCRTQNPETKDCGEFWSFKRTLRTNTRDPLTRQGWELLQREDRPFRSWWSERRKASRARRRRSSLPHGGDVYNRFRRIGTAQHDLPPDPAREVEAQNS